MLLVAVSFVVVVVVVVVTFYSVCIHMALSDRKTQNILFKKHIHFCGRSRFWDVGSYPIGSMGLVFLPTFTIKSPKCRQIYQSHGSYRVCLVCSEVQESHHCTVRLVWFYQAGQHAQKNGGRKPGCQLVGVGRMVVGGDLGVQETKMDIINLGLLNTLLVGVWTPKHLLRRP